MEKALLYLLLQSLGLIQVNLSDSFLKNNYLYSFIIRYTEAMFLRSGYF